LSAKNPPIARTQYQAMAPFQRDRAILLDFCLKYLSVPLYMIAVTKTLNLSRSFWTEAALS
jgi:hypothetical protein